MQISGICSVRSLRIAMFVMLASAAPLATDARGQLPPISGLELSGSVLEKETKEPIEGAFVLASYQELIVGQVGVTSWCVKTKGMYTGRDGRYRFPVEKRDGYSPFTVQAIKPGYFHGGGSELPITEVWQRQDTEAYSGRDLYLVKQDPEKPDFHIGTGEEFCNHGRSAADVSAAIEFLQIKLAEGRRLGAKQQGIDAATGMIERLKSIP